MQHGRHPTFRQYVVVATALFLITIVEFLLIWKRAGIVDDLGASKVPLLVGLSAIKFGVVIMFYMHLKFDSRLFSAVFLAGLALAFAVGIAVLGLFVALNGEPREFAETNRVAFVHGAEGENAKEEGVSGPVSGPGPTAGNAEGTGQPAQAGTQESTSAEAVTPESPAVRVAAAVALDITTEGDALKFSTGTLTIQAGVDVVLNFGNGSNIFQHNWVLVRAEDKAGVVTDGALAGPANDWIKPDDPRVIAYTKLLNPGETGEVRFTAPEPGPTFKFVCTFPGHDASGMFGDFQVNS